MSQKNATPTDKQQEILQRHKLDRYLWVVVKELQSLLIVKHRITGEFKVLSK